MQHGLRVHLDPRGGNQINLREALRLLNPPDIPGTDSEASSTASSASVEPRRTALDDYDYDDDFIDDGDLVYDEEVPPTPTSSVDGSDLQSPMGDDVIGAPDARGGKKDIGGVDRENDQVGKAKQIQPKNVLTHGFTTFYLSRGTLPAKSAIDTATPVLQPTSRLGNVVVDFPPRARKRFEQQLAQYSAVSEDRPALPSSPRNNAVARGSTPSISQGQHHIPTPTITMAPSSDANSPNNPSHESFPGNALLVPSPNLGPNSGDVSYDSGTGVANDGLKTNVKRSNTSTIPEAVMVEIIRLRTLCTERFGDKKPKNDDPPLQQQLNRFFRTAINTGSARLYSDVKKDKRVVALADEIWAIISPILRMKRANLETLGHALIWSDREKAAKSAVDFAESAISSLLTERRGGVPVDSVVPLEWDKSLDELIFNWYKARTELLDAKNQLGSRHKTIKKSLPVWVASFKKQALTGWSVAEADIIDAINRMEDQEGALRREKLEKKRKRDMESNTSKGVGSECPESISEAADMPTKKAAVDNSDDAGKPTVVKNVSASEATQKLVSKKASEQDVRTVKVSKHFSEESSWASKAPPKAVLKKLEAVKPTLPKASAAMPVLSSAISSTQKYIDSSTLISKAPPQKSVLKGGPKGPHKNPMKSAMNVAAKSFGKDGPKTPLGPKLGKKVSSKTPPSGVKVVSNVDGGANRSSKSGIKPAKKKSPSGSMASISVPSKPPLKKKSSLKSANMPSDSTSGTVRTPLPVSTGLTTEMEEKSNYVEVFAGDATKVSKVVVQREEVTERGPIASAATSGGLGLPVSSTQASMPIGTPNRLLPRSEHVTLMENKSRLPSPPLLSARDPAPPA